MENKLKVAIKWVVFFTVLFFVIGVMLTKDGNSYDSIKLYGLLKDSFAFGFGFMAPALAIVLYDDWRKQHVEKRVEIGSSEILDNLDKCIALNIDIFFKINWLNGCDEMAYEAIKLLKSNETHSINLTQKLIDNMDRHNNKLLNFKSKADSVLAHIKQMSICADSLLKSKREHFWGDGGDINIPNSYLDICSKFSVSYASYQFDLQDLMLELRSLKENLKIVGPN